MLILGQTTITGGNITSTDGSGIYCFNTVNISGNSTNITGKTNGIAVISGTTTVIGGNITSTESAGIALGNGSNESTLNLGANDSTVSTTSPRITGVTYGVDVRRYTTFNFYDGVIIGATNQSISKEPNAIPDDCEILKTNTATQETAILRKLPILLSGANFNAAIKGTTWNTDNTDIKSITFGKTSQYFSNSIVPGIESVTPIPVDVDRAGTINAYKLGDATDGYDVYVLSDAKIFANEDASYMFNAFTGLASVDVSVLDTSKVTDMTKMFAGSRKVTGSAVQHVRHEGNIKILNLSNFDTSNVTSMYGMFAYQVSLESVNLSSFDTSNVTRMDEMFNACTSLTTLDLSNFNTSNVTYMDGMFTCLISDNSNMIYQYYNNSTTTRSSLTTIYVSDLWDISKVRGETTIASRMFNDCVSLVGAISYDSSKTNKEYANYETGYLTYKSNT